MNGRTWSLEKTGLLFIWIKVTSFQNHTEQQKQNTIIQYGVKRKLTVSPRTNKNITYINRKTNENEMR